MPPQQASPQQASPNPPSAGQALPPRTRRKKLPKPLPPTHCLNCGTPATGKFCAECGQENEDQTVAVKLLARDLLSDVASFDSKLLRTLVPLVVRPGFLTNEYNAGKRVCYLSPFKLYLTLSVLFFLVLPLTQHGSLVNTTTLDSAPAQAGAALHSARQTAAQIQADKDYQDAQAELKSAIQDDAPGLKVAPPHGRAMLLVGHSSYDLTHLPVTVEAYNAQQRDLRQAPDPKLVQYLKRQIIKVKQSPKSLSDALLDYIPKMMFVLLPAFALSLKLIYLRSKRFYIEHLVFSLHLHAFLFLLLTLLLLVDFAAPRAAAATPLAVIAALLYPYFAMRVVYKQSWGKTFLKYVLLALNYLILAAFMFLTALAAAFLFI